MRLLICGSRRWKDERAIGKAILQLKPKVVIHGGARGADFMAGRNAERLEIPVEVYLADWDLHHEAAGPIRNQRMLQEGKPDVVLGFAESLSSARGTSDMLRRAVKWPGTKKVFHWDGKEWHTLKNVA